jgi:hypothetical protein
LFKESLVHDIDGKEGRQGLNKEAGSPPHPNGAGVGAIDAVRSEEVTPAPTTAATNGFQVGDRVIITNKISHTLRGAPGSNTDRIGIVKKVTAERVFFVTLAGTHTCRAPKNLRLIEAPVNGFYF